MSDGFLRRLTSGRWEPSERELHDYLDRALCCAPASSGKNVVALLAALSARPLTVPSVVHFVSYVRRHTPPRELSSARGAVNIVGTGGGAPTINISTAAAFLASAAGASVLKSGSSRYSSAAGAMDVLRALRVPMPRDGTELEQMLLATGLGFVPESHAAPVLRRIAASVYPLALRDVGGFVNTIGPLLCPYRVSGQVIGVSRRDDFDVLAEAILALDLRRTLLVRSTSGMDELCSVTTNRAEWIDGHRLSIDIATEELGFVRGTWQDLAGADAAHNAEALRGIIGGTRVGPSRDTVVLNAGAALLVAGVASSIADGVRRAARAIESGQALSKLNLITAWRGARDARNGARVCEPLEGP